MFALQESTITKACDKCIRWYYMSHNRGIILGIQDCHVSAGSSDLGHHGGTTLGIVKQSTIKVRLKQS